MLLPENYITQQDSAQQPSPSVGGGQVPSDFIVNDNDL